MNHCVSAFLVAALVISAATPSVFAEEATSADIAEQPLHDALKEFANKSGLQVVYLAEVVAGIKSKRVSGRLSNKEKLAQMLFNTKLQYEFINERTVSITEKIENVQGGTGGGKNSAGVQQAPGRPGRNVGKFSTGEIEEK